MAAHRYVQYTKQIRYSVVSGYVMFHLPPAALPAFSYAGASFDAKEELHCSLLCTAELAKYFENSEIATLELASFVQDFVTKSPISFKKFTRDVYLCKKDDAQSIVIEIHMNGVDELYAALRSAFSPLSKIPSPALHVTLYKYNHQYGIGIQNKAELNAMCKPLPFEQLPNQLQEQL